MAGATRPKLSQLRKWQRLEVKRLKLQRQVKDLATLQGQLETDFRPYVEAEGGPEKCVFLDGFRLAIELKNGSVSWQKEFVKVTSEAAAEELRKAVANTKSELVIKAPAE
jgi:hypothetical protein